MLDLGGANAIGEGAESAVGGSMTVAADDHGARKREALLRSDDVANALSPIQLVVVLQPEELGVFREIGDLRRALGIRVGFGAARCRDVVVDDQ